MTASIRAALILGVCLSVGLASSSTALADKKDKKNESNSNSNSSSSASSNLNSNEKRKDKGDDQNNQRRERRRDDNQNSNVQQLQNAFQGSGSKQNKSGSSQDSQQSQSQQSQQSQKVQQFNPFQKSQQGQNSQGQKQQQFQNFQKQNDPQFNDPKQGFSQQGNKNKWQKNNHNDRKELNDWVVQFGGSKPFSSKWYKDHPKAWQYHRRDRDADWKAVTAAGVVGFLGWQAYQQRGPAVVYEPVPYDRLFVSQPGVVIDSDRGDWMPLGVYSLMVAPGDVSTRMLDLAVDRHGHIRGSYYDIISGASYNVAGIIDQRTQYAQWSLESNRQLTFYAPLGELLQSQGIVNVQLPSGQRQEWQLVRMVEDN